jgi:SAM-dependent methyltransferase
MPMAEKGSAPPLSTNAADSSAPADVEGLVAAVYRQILDREPDPGGWAFYAGRLREGMPVEDLLHSFVTSAEFRDKQRATNRRLAADESMFRDDVGEAAKSSFPLDYRPPGEAGRSYELRVRNGFLDRYCSGGLVLDVGFSGYDNPDGKTGVPGAIGIDVNYPGYDGRHLPFADASVDTVFSSHCLEHILYDHAAIQDWYRVLKVGGFIVCIVPSQALYEKKRFLPSRFNEDHKRMYSPASLVGSFEQALAVNSYRVRHLAENDRGFNYRLGPDVHSDGAYEIELVVEKITPPAWDLA